MRSWLLFGFLITVFVGCKPPAPNTKPQIVTSAETTDPTDGSQTNAGDSAVDSTAKVATNITKPTATTATTKLQVISFDELNLGMPEDSKFRPMMLQVNNGRAEELNGARISIGGHMNPPDQLTGLNEFVLLKNKDCKFGPGGQADHLMRVFMKDGKTTDYTDAVIYVEGILTIKPFPEDGPSTWSIYDIEATSVSTRAPSRQR